MNKFLACIFTLLLCTLSGCKSISSEGSMRIVVEQYNGPLSKTLEVQKAELSGTLSVADETLKILVREFHLSQCLLGCFGEGADKLAKQQCLMQQGVDGLVDLSQVFSLAQQILNLSAQISSQQCNPQNCNAEKALQIQLAKALDSEIDRLEGMAQVLVNIPQAQQLTTTGFDATAFKALTGKLAQSQANLQGQPLAQDKIKTSMTEISNLKGEYLVSAAGLSAVESLLGQSGSAMSFPYSTQKPPVLPNTVPLSEILPAHIVSQYPKLFARKPQALLGSEDKNRLQTSQEDELHRVCPVLSDVKTNMLAVLNYINLPLDPRDPLGKSIRFCASALYNKDEDVDSRYQACLNRIAKTGHMLRKGAEQWAATQMAILPKSKRVRIVVGRASVAAAELGNELVARADAIRHQENKGNNIEHAASLLPTSMYLRGASGTDYLNMVDWMEAYPDREGDSWQADDRTRMVERLITDANWDQVNTAFARGNGDVGMVFVKDDIGNWNLKSYDNDPSELLQSYKQVGTTLLNEAVSLAKGSSKLADLTANLSGITKLNQSANQIMLNGAAGGSAAQTTIETLEHELRKRLAEAANLQAQNEAQLNQAEQALSKELEAVKSALNDAENDYSQQQKRFAQVSKELIVAESNYETKKAQEERALEKRLKAQLQQSYDQDATIKAHQQAKAEAEVAKLEYDEAKQKVEAQTRVFNDTQLVFEKTSRIIKR
ncbi:hypothetical protein [Pseudoalteromonas viridis]|uniref:Uncharacterized protein n=1 Tax=Pseudoalteromonas viridis TaxID=339617 RepID=A0ABX7VD77_9GAMM|nr:hypothetical protein [Pseudoalteromonas viridis]QTL37861.1 hypothetical protein J5X90_19150 [Pseudoalteromonas viridis]